MNNESEIRVKPGLLARVTSTGGMTLSSDDTIFVGLTCVEMDSLTAWWLAHRAGQPTLIPEPVSYQRICSALADGDIEPSEAVEDIGVVASRAIERALTALKES